MSDLGLGNPSSKTNSETDPKETTEMILEMVTETNITSTFETNYEPDNQNNKPEEIKSDNHDANKNKNSWEKRQIWNRPEEEKVEISTWREPQENFESKAENQRNISTLSNVTITNKEDTSENRQYTESADINKIDNELPGSTYIFEDNQTQNREEEKLNKSRNNINEEQYTYESAIQGYRSRVKTNLSNNMFFKQYSNPQNSEPVESETNIIVPKGSILKRKELFESEKVFEINSYESPTSKRLYDDLVNTQSLKERLQSLEKCTAKPIKTADEVQKKIDSNKTRSSMLECIKSDLEKSQNKWEENSNTVINKWENEKVVTLERATSPETNIFVNKIEKFCYSLENLATDNKEGLDYVVPNYPASNSPMDLLGIYFYLFFLSMYS